MPGRKRRETTRNSRATGLDAPSKPAPDAARLASRLAAETAERRRLQEALRAVPMDILAAQDRERRRIAAELHDGVTQILSSTKFRLAHVQSKARSKEGKIITEVRELVERAIKEVRRISKNLRPTELDDFGLVAAVEQLMDDFRDRTKLELDFKRGPLPKRLPPQVELAIYRILQEALANVEQHANARRVVVSLSVDVNFAMLMVMDDGKGFSGVENMRRSGDNRGFGMVNMRERAQALGGVFAIKSAPGKGTEIVVHVKLAR